MFDPSGKLLRTTINSRPLTGFVESVLDIHSIHCFFTKGPFATWDSTSSSSILDRIANFQRHSFSFLVRAFTMLSSLFSTALVFATALSSVYADSAPDSTSDGLTVSSDLVSSTDSLISAASSFLPKKTCKCVCHTKTVLLLFH